MCQLGVVANYPPPVPSAWGLFNESSRGPPTYPQLLGPCLSSGAAAAAAAMGCSKQGLVDKAFDWETNKQVKSGACAFQALVFDLQACQIPGYCSLEGCVKTLEAGVLRRHEAWGFS